MTRIQSRIISPMLSDPCVDLNGHSLSLDAAGAAEVVVNMLCPPCSCVIDMYKACVAAFLCSN